MEVNRCCTGRREMEICLTFILLSSTLTLTTAGSVRLVDGGSRCAGRVEVFQDGQWGTVCGYNWDMTDAAVVCRDLGCDDAVDAPQYGHFGPGSGPIWIFNVGCRGSESTLKECGSLQSWNHFCNHGEDAGVICSGHRKSRLSDGPHWCSGRVEVLQGKTWYTVCDAAFDQQEAEVVCRELGCGIPVEVLGAAAFDRGEVQVWTEELQCTGNESEVSFCPRSSTINHNCSHSNDVGLICSGHTEARLVNGPDSCSGRVELQYLSDWGTVCGVSWDMRAASVLCAQLKCGSAVAVLESDWFGEGSGQIWADVFDCQGNETHLSQCSISSWSRAACSHKQDAGVICNGSSLVFHEGRVRLTGGSECHGEVEVFLEQDWRRVLLDSWSLAEGSVLCRQLGCGTVLNYGSSPSITEQSQICVMAFNCSGSEAHLRNCSSAEPVNCSSREQLYISCSGHFKPDHSSIRLVGSGGDCAGRLEVFHRGSWGTVCDDLWDIEDAQVVCRQLQCGLALSTHIPAWFGSGTGPIWMNKVQCEGNETSLWNCRFQLCEEDECGHQEDVGVVCSEFKEIRLTEGCKGNLEVFYNGTWGNVCENGVNTETASLICQELNCGRTGTEYFGEARVKSAPDWLDDLRCRKHDSTLWHCPSSPWGKNRCDRVAQITCSEKKQDLVRQNHLTCYTLPHQRQCSKHLPLRLSGGKGSCSGKLEVYHNATWGSVCDDQWDINDAQVVCRQLGCGRALSADMKATFGAGERTSWLNSVKCRGDEIHLWDCRHSLKYHTSCSHRQEAGVTCEDLTVTTTTATSTTTTTRGLSKRRRLTVPEAVYEEIDHRFITRRTRSSTKRRSLLSEEQNSGYEDVDEDLPSEKSGIGEKAEDYDDVITNNELISDTAEVDTPEDYDDVITAEPIPDNLAEDAPENYDDVITADQRSEVMREEIPEDYGDAVTMETNPNILTDQSEDYDDVISAEQEVGGAEDDDDVENSQTDSDHVTEKHHRVPFFRKLQFNIYNLKK